MLKFKRPVGATTAQEKINKRLLVIYAFIFVLFCVLVGRLFIMQVVQGGDYTERADSNIYRTIALPARRGTIYDMNGNVLASSQPYMSIEVYPSEVEDPEALAENLAELFSRDDIFEAEQAAREVLAQSTLSDSIDKVNKEMIEKEKAEKEAAIAAGEVVEEEEEEEEEVVEVDVNAATGSLTANTKPSKDEVLEIINAGLGSYAAITVRTYTYDVGVTIAQIVAENPDLYPAVYVSEEPMRSYPNGYYLGHVLGTVGKITEGQLEEMTAYGYTIADTVGQSGLESYYEYYTEDGKVYSLSGEDGNRVVDVDAKNNIIDVISEEAPVAGHSLELTIDLNTQIHMEDSLKNTITGIHDGGNEKCKGGSAVLLDVDTGGVIAMASAPSIDPNAFARGLTPDELNYYFNDDYKPQMNRAVTAGYASGSTFKMMTATAVLKAGISPSDSVNCSEASWAEPLAKCPAWHGTTDFYNAVKGSCNTYFQRMAARVGEEGMIEMGLAYGFGQKTGIDLPAENDGLLPTPEWKSQNYTGWESSWHVYDTYYMAMGQGATVDTVIQLASYVATIANRGERMKPYICQSILDDEGNVLKTQEPTVVATIELNNDSDWDIITNAMKGVVSDDGGTARNLFGSLPTSLTPAGKTGTAQTGLRGDNNESDYHGVFIAFAPADNPQVAFAGLVEYGHHGGTSAGYVCRDTFRAYFGYDVNYDIILMDGLVEAAQERREADKAAEEAAKAKEEEEAAAAESTE
ncbi:MAG: hypothetical protein IIY02_03645 [Firmicutes bacterium]|nr:hypothetical protein [Bacillota bacterium]